MPAEPAAYRPVIVIPVYNHPATVEDVVRRLLSTGTPVLLVDDASDPPAQEACERCRAMGAGLVCPNLSARIVEVFLNTAFEGGRHARRVGLITEMEK